tara:strand:+ start:710 stop:1678 length:969 start_codon:yes stop_codon:yes gene_type:complete
MAFLDNSGDIILDVTLTDEGRRRLAKGDGSFRIVKFALGDEEINYQLYNTSHVSGTSYYDLEILQTPVLEAFTNNTSTMKTKLMTIPRNNILFLPVLRLNENFDLQTAMHVKGAFMVAADCTTENDCGNTSATSSVAYFKGVIKTGFMLGTNPKGGGSYVRVDAGLDTNNLGSSPSSKIDPALAESQYIIQIDNRLGGIASKDGLVTLTPTSIDDDNVAQYAVSLGTNRKFVKQNNNKDQDASQVIRGPRSTFLEFKIISSLDLRTSYYLFNQFGSTETMVNNSAAGDKSSNVKFIDSLVRVTGINTGYSVDLPVRFIKVTT